MGNQGTKSGTFSNRSGLPQVPAGSTGIPQSLLNNLGRQIDASKVAPNAGMISTQLPGGVSIDFDSSVSAQSFFQPHAFQVFVSEVGTNLLKVNIAEGRIFGRVDWLSAFVANPIIPVEPAYNIPSLGTAGLEPGFTGVFPDDKVPDTTGNQGGASTPAGQSTSNSGGAGSTTNKPQANGGGYVSGNAGSVTNPGQQGGVYHNDFSVTGNGSYIGGNAGTFNSFGQGGTYSSNLFATGNGTYVSGNAGSVTSGGNQSGTFNPTLQQSTP